MKKLLTISAAICMFFLLSSCEEKAEEILIATMDGDNITLNEKILNKKFPDGGDIKSFEVQKFEKGYGLVRSGSGGKGGSMTDLIWLQESERGLSISRTPKIKLLICPSPDCLECGFNFNTNDCDCQQGSGECEMGSLGIQWADYEIANNLP